MTDETGLAALAAADDLLPHPSMRCEIGEHDACLFATSGCPCSCHRAAALAWLDARLVDPATVGSVARAINAADDAALVRTNFGQICATYDEQATAALAAVRGLLGVEA